MTMQWHERGAVLSLFNKRQELHDWLWQVKTGLAECAIRGRYLRKEMSEAHKARLDELMHDFLTTEIAHVDAQLAKLGIKVSDAPTE